MESNVGRNKPESELSKRLSELRHLCIECGEQIEDDEDEDSSFCKKCAEIIFGPNY